MTSKLSVLKKFLYEKIFLKSKDIAAFESRAVNFFPEPNEKKLTPSIE